MSGLNGWVHLGLGWITCCEESVKTNDILSLLHLQSPRAPHSPRSVAQDTRPTLCSPIPAVSFPFCELVGALQLSTWHLMCLQYRMDLPLFAHLTSVATCLPQATHPVLCGPALFSVWCSSHFRTSFLWVLCSGVLCIFFPCSFTGSMGSVNNRYSCPT